MSSYKFWPVWCEGRELIDTTRRKAELKSLFDEGKREEWKAGLKTQHENN